MHIVTERVLEDVGGIDANDARAWILPTVDNGLLVMTWISHWRHHETRGGKRGKDATLNGRVSRRLLSSSIFQLPFTLVVGGKDGYAVRTWMCSFCSPQSKTMLFISCFSHHFLSFSWIESIGRENNERLVDNQSQPFFFPPTLASSPSSLLLPTKVKILKR